MIAYLKREKMKIKFGLPDWSVWLLAACALISPTYAAIGVLLAIGLLNRHELRRWWVIRHQQIGTDGDRNKIDAVASSYVAKIDKDFEPGFVEARFDLLVRSGLAELEGIPDALARLEDLINRKGKQDPVPPSLDKRTIFTTARWAAKHDARFQSNAHEKYLQAIASGEGGPPMPWATDPEIQEDIRAAKRAAQPSHSLDR
jgi:hypothetical protein